MNENYLETERLRMRWLVAADAPFIIDLLNDPGWLRYIGERNVRTNEQALAYIENGPGKMYVSHGFGMYMVERKSDGAALGLCGLIKRDGIDDVDIGFAMLEQYVGNGYGYESAAAVIKEGRAVFGLGRIAAITTKDNHASIALIKKLGMNYERDVTLPNDDEALLMFVLPYNRTHALRAED